MERLRMTGGDVLLADGGFQREDVLMAGGGIAGIGSGGGADMALDGRGLLVLPGIVDIHGDAFERQMQPRPGVDFPADIALADTEAQLLANGITTAFHGVTLSWEPGLRSLEAWRTLLDALAAGTWTCDMRVHLRWEAFNLDALDTALADIAAGRVHLLAFNDHTPAILRRIGDPVTGAKYSDRAGMRLDAFRALAARVGAAEDRVPAALDRIGAAAREAGMPMASHDDETVAMRDAFRDARRADLRVPDGGGGRRGGARGRRLGGDGQPQRGARRIASRLGLGRGAGGGGHLHRAVVGLLLPGDDARRIRAGGARRAGPAAGLGADFGQPRGGGGAGGSRQDRRGQARRPGAGRSVGAARHCDHRRGAHRAPDQRGRGQAAGRLGSHPHPTLSRRRERVGLRGQVSSAPKVAAKVLVIRSSRRVPGTKSAMPSGNDRSGRWRTHSDFSPRTCVIG